MPLAVHAGVRHRCVIAGELRHAGLQGDTAVDPERAGGLLGGREPFRRLVARRGSDLTLGGPGTGTVPARTDT